MKDFAFGKTNKTAFPAWGVHAKFTSP